MQEYFKPVAPAPSLLEGWCNHGAQAHPCAIPRAEKAEKRIAELEAECSTRHCYASELYAIANDAIDCARRWGGKNTDYVTAALLARRREADARCREGLAKLAASPAAQSKEPRK